MENYKFSKTHEWICYHEQDIYRIGISDFAQNALTDIVYADFKEEGTSLEKDSEICVLESTKSAASIYAPVNCEIIKNNKELIDNPYLINESPYEDGWICEVKIENIEDLNNLLDYDEYIKLTEEESH